MSTDTIDVIETLIRKRTTLSKLEARSLAFDIGEAVAKHYYEQQTATAAAKVPQGVSSES